MKCKAFVILIYLLWAVAGYEAGEKQTQSLSGDYGAKIVGKDQKPVEIGTKITNYTQVEDIPQKDLRKSRSNVYQMGPNHYLIHKSKVEFLEEGKKRKPEDTWLEVEFSNARGFYDEPSASNELYAESGGSAMFTKSLEVGLSLVRYSSFQRSYVLASLSSSASFTFGPSVKVTVEASCKVPPGKLGALYLFEKNDQVEGKIREWTWTSKRYSKSKYKPGEWQEKNEVIRSFEEPVFVCSLDPEYIGAINKKVHKPSPLSDFTDFVDKKFKEM